MVSKTLKVKDILSWHHVLEVISENVILVPYYPDEKTMVKIQLDKASVDIIKQKRLQIAQFMEQEITLSGTVVEKQVLQTRTKTEEVEEWVRVE